MSWYNVINHSQNKLAKSKINTFPCVSGTFYLAVFDACGGL